MSSWYSDFPARRVRQILADIAAAVAIVIAILAGVAVYTAVTAFADIGVQMEQAGTGFQDTMGEAGETLGGVPLIGSDIRVPFDSASSAGGALADAGQAQQDFVHGLALALAVPAAVGPVLLVAAVWLPPRLFFAHRSREARALLRTADGPELLALRALARRPLVELASVSPAPLDGWRARDVTVVTGLAQLELRRAGVRA